VIDLVIRNGVVVTPDAEAVLDVASASPSTRASVLLREKPTTIGRPSAASASSRWTSSRL
jgi:hypothetical protein